MTALNGKINMTQSADDIEKQIAELQRKAEAQRQSETTEKQNRLAIQKAQDLETRDNLLKEVNKLDAASTMTGKLTLDDAMKLAERRQRLLDNIEEIELEHGLNSKKQAEAEVSESKRKPYGISTTKAIWALIVMFSVCCLLTGWLGATAIADPMNPVGQSMMKNAPLRALVAFDMTFLTMLVAVFFIWLFFNDLFLLWHNRIQSERNLSTLLAEAPAWAVLFFLLGSFFLVMWLFANYYLTAYA